MFFDFTQFAILDIFGLGTVSSERIKCYHWNPRSRAPYGAGERFQTASAVRFELKSLTLILFSGPIFCGYVRHKYVKYFRNAGVWGKSNYQISNLMYATFYCKDNPTLSEEKIMFITHDKTVSCSYFWHKHVEE